MRSVFDLPAALVRLSAFADMTLMLLGGAAPPSITPIINPRISMR
jgi:hypothetical protein